jgi:hypothetical protein
MQQVVFVEGSLQCWLLRAYHLLEEDTYEQQSSNLGL